VTRPLVVDDVVIFGSEDRSVYWLNAETGAEIRRNELGGPIVSSPVLVNGLAIFGCDDGGVYAFDAKSGEERWRFAAEEPVEAPIVAADGMVLAGTHGGDLYAIDLTNGTAIWSARAGGELRSAPVGRWGQDLSRQRRWPARRVRPENGRRLWSSDEEDYVGPPVLAGETLILGSKNGDAHAVDLNGRRQRTWAAANASSPSDGVAGLTLGASEGGGAVWFGDKRSVIRRLGSAADAGPAALRASWLLPFTSEPLAQSFLTIAPVAYGNQALVLDGSRNIFVLDPKTGKGKRIGAFGDKLAPTIEPTVAGDTLISMAGTTLFATDLPSGAPRWKFENTEAGVQPVTVAGETALWLTQHFPAAQDGKPQMPIGKLHALDLKTGAVRWQRPLTGFMGIGRAVVFGSTIFTSAPAAAFDLATGEPRWQAQLTNSPLGGGALNDAGDTLFIGMVQSAGSRASIAALRTTDGSVVWESDIGESSLNPLERPWLSAMCWWCRSTPAR
jgi:outer membrane protein assembly factor BamB